MGMVWDVGDREGAAEVAEEVIAKAQAKLE